MKKYVLITFLFLLLIIQSGCAVADDKSLSEVTLESHEEIQFQYEAELAELNEKVDSLQGEKQGLETELAVINDIFTEIHMQPMEFGACEELYNRKWMTAEKVELRKVPVDTGISNVKITDLSYDMVNVIGVVYVSGNESWDYIPWALIRYESQETVFDTAGWVRLDEMVEYTEGTMHLLRSPISLAEGAVDSETNEIVEEKEGLAITDYEGDYVKLFGAGGKFYKVHKDSIIYPNPNPDVLSVPDDRFIEMVKENYEDGEISTSDIVIDQIYYGSFSEEDVSEIFVLCKILNTPHAAGLDKKIGILLDAHTLEMVAYKEFGGDKTEISCMPMSNGQSRILFFQTSIYQGISTQTVELYAVQGSQWVEIPIDIMENVPAERREALEGKCFCYLSGERMVVVYEDNQFEDELTDSAEMIAMFIWNPDTGQFVLE